MIEEERLRASNENIVVKAGYVIAGIHCVMCYIIQCRTQLYSIICPGRSLIVPMQGERLYLALRFVGYI